jgi:hypothetical protein
MYTIDFDKAELDTLQTALESLSGTAAEMSDDENYDGDLDELQAYQDRIKGMLEKVVNGITYLTSDDEPTEEESARINKEIDDDEIAQGLRNPDGSDL